MYNAKKQRHRQPWARAAALLIGCIVTFIGLAQHLDPEVLLFRVLVASTTTGVIIAAASACMRGLAPKS
jgi:hypothetical protein